MPVLKAIKKARATCSADNIWKRAKTSGIERVVPVEESFQALCAANMDRVVEERMTARAAEQAAFDRGEGPAPTPIVCLGNECSKNCF